MGAPERMRAARWHGVRDIRVEEVETPRPAAGEVLVRIDRAGICGSDLEEYLAGPVSIPVEPHPRTGAKAPITLGHELVGTVVDCPSGALAVGTRVVPDVVVGCGECWWCRRREEGLCPRLWVRGQQGDGGLAEYMVADAGTCVVVPTDVPVDVAAFAEPVSVAARALRKAGDLVGTVVVVVGAGVIGQLIAQLALAGGAVDVLAVDPVEARQELARSFGAVGCSPADAGAAIGSLTDGRGGDVVLECSGARGTVASSLALTRPGGTVILVGFRADSEPLPLLPAVLGERRILGTAAHLWDEDVATAVALLSRGIVRTDPLRSVVVPLGEVVSGGFERMLADRDAFKVLINPGA